MSTTRQGGDAPVVTSTDIVRGLRAMGVQDGMGLMVHSSLSSFGRVEGGAGTVVEALKECVGPEGTVLMPSFNHSGILEEGGAGFYDPATTPTSNGAVPEHFWRGQDVRRSLNPTHAVAAWGRNAERYTATHHRTLTFGRGSPLGMLWADDGWCLLLGVGYTSNSFHHVVETECRAPCLGRRTEAVPVQLPDGTKAMGRTWGWREEDCPLTGQSRYAEVMAAAKLETVGHIGACRATLFRLNDCFEVVARVLREGTDEYPPCSRCPIHPRSVPNTVDSDWDDEQNRLKPDSDSWEF